MRPLPLILALSACTTLPVNTLVVTGEVGDSDWTELNTVTVHHNFNTDETESLGEPVSDIIISVSNEPDFCALAGPTGDLDMQDLRVAQVYLTVASVEEGLYVANGRGGPSGLDKTSDVAGLGTVVVIEDGDRVVWAQTDSEGVPKVSVTIAALQGGAAPLDGQFKMQLRSDVGSAAERDEDRNGDGVLDGKRLNATVEARFENVTWCRPRE